ncbi:hypothetical protein EVAR_85687_1 [Eumeta japonica]|uniref:Uncharacterized protein n=1 Tax=Eumeta variegata TaxID=151549 RepID=A0A4C1WC69_EUMVA|nr:hypothetical protein EVAR_85687_1 [Eumeta japonica]
MWTLISPDGKTKNEIDFITTNRASYFTNFSVIKRFNFNTNHRLIRAELKTYQPRKPRPRLDPAKKLGRQQIEQITIALRDEFADFKDSTRELGIQEKYNSFENTIKTQTKLIAKPKIDTTKWLSTNTTQLLEERKHFISASETRNRRKKLAKISKEIKESIRKDRK